MTDTPMQIVLAHREKVILRLADTAEKLLTNPNSAATGKMEAVSGVLQDELGVFERWVISYHDSSSAQYALRDIPPDQRAAYERAKHMIGLLRQLYGPQSELT